MAIYHCSVKAVSRSAGRSSTAAAAYRAGCEITDGRTGEIHDYTKKRGVESTDIVLPDGAPAWANDRSALWNAAETAERRKDACVAREFEVALPSELSPSERRRLAVDFAREMANREGCAVDVAIHAPGKEGDSRNHHAHILRTTRKVGPNGLTDKLDTEKAGRHRAADLDAARTRWADLVNERLRENGIEARVDHRSLKEQGVDREPTSHKGPAVAAMERRGVQTDVGQRIAIEVAQRLANARAEGIQERELAHTSKSIIDVAGDLQAAINERDHRLKAQEKAQVARQSAVATELPSRVQKTPVAPPMTSVAAVLVNVVSNFGQPNKTAPAPARRNADDAALFQGTEKAIAVAQVSGSSKDIEVLASRFRKIDQVQSELTRSSTPSSWDTRPFDERSAAQDLANHDANRRREAINAEAKAAGHTKVPFAVGQNTLISASFDHGQKAAAEALARHVQSERPLGLFRRETKDTKAWDEQGAALATKKAAWDKAIGWRDNKEAVAVEADRATFYPRLDVVRKEYTSKSDAAIAKCAPARERLQDFSQERKRLESIVEKALSPAKLQELSRQRGRGHGMER